MNVIYAISSQVSVIRLKKSQQPMKTAAAKVQKRELPWRAADIFAVLDCAKSMYSSIRSIKSAKIPGLSLVLMVHEVAIPAHKQEGLCLTDMDKALTRFQLRLQRPLPVKERHSLPWRGSRVTGSDCVLKRHSILPEQYVWGWGVKL